MIPVTLHHLANLGKVHPENLARAHPHNLRRPEHRALLVDEVRVVSPQSRVDPLQKELVLVRRARHIRRLHKHRLGYARTAATGTSLRLLARLLLFLPARSAASCHSSKRCASDNASRGNLLLLLQITEHGGHLLVRHRSAQLDICHVRPGVRLWLGTGSALIGNVLLLQ